MKGFVITLLSILLIVLLVSFASVLHGNYLAMERVLEEPRPLMYASALFDSVAQDVNWIVGPSIRSEDGNGSLVLRIQDSLPKRNFTSELAAYEAFLEGEFADQANSEIGADLSGLKPDGVEVMINGRHRYSNSGDKAYFEPGAGPGASAYNLTITVNGSRMNITTFAFEPGGDLNVSIVYKDKNGTVSQSGSVFSGNLTSFSVNYTGGGRLEVAAGRAGGKDGAFSVDTHNVSANFTLAAALPPRNQSERPGYEYGAWLNYSQGKISMERSIGK